jgi:hypothetical protein
MWIIYIISHSWRLASIGTISIWILSCIPLNGTCLNSTESIDPQKFINVQNQDTLIRTFDKLEHVFDSSQDLFVEGQKFLQTFINEINIKYNLKLTIQDACKLVRENLYIFDLPEETKKILFLTINLYEANSNHMKDQKEELESLIIEFNNNVIANAIYWPWSWFGSNKDEKPKGHHPLNHHVAHTNSSTYTDKELPGNCYVGACELLAGALLCLIPTPTSMWLGTIMMGDGVRRLIDGSIQLNDERRNDPNYIYPADPPGFNF